MNANERFEIVAALFKAHTGYLRPGKDVGYAMASESYEQARQEAWKEWSTPENIRDAALMRIHELEEKIEQMERAS